MALPRLIARAAAGVLALALVLAAGAPAREGAVGFLGGVEDLPLMAGLTEVPEARMVFDKPAGRIVEAFAVGELEADSVRAFYAAALPQLGWARLGRLRFAREGEILEIGIDTHGTAVTVRFSILPR